MKHHLAPLSINSGTGSQMNAVPLSPLDWYNYKVQMCLICSGLRKNLRKSTRISQIAIHVHWSKNSHSFGEHLVSDKRKQVLNPQSQDMAWAPLILAPFSAARSRCFGSDQSWIKVDVAMLMSWVSLRFLRALLVIPTMKTGCEMRKTICRFPSTQPSKRLRFSFFGVVISLKPHWISSTFMPSHGAHCRYTGNKLCCKAWSTGKNYFDTRIRKLLQLQKGTKKYTKMQYVCTLW